MPTHQPAQRLDPRAPLVLDTRDLPRSPGAQRALDRVVPAPDDLGLDLIRVPVGSDLTLRLRMQSVSEGVLVSAEVTGPLVGECGRCLRDLTDTFDVQFQQLYAYPKPAQSSARPVPSSTHNSARPVDDTVTDETTEDEVGQMDGDLIDLEPELRDAVVLALPHHPRCREDCPGLCPECGEAWDDLPADHHHDQFDTRWAALDKLRDH